MGTIYDVFISSPGDVAEERDAINRVISKVNHMLRDRDVALRQFDYKQHVAGVIGVEPAGGRRRSCST